MTVSNIIQELAELTAQNRQGVEALYEAEYNLAEAESVLDREEAKFFLDASGSVAERQAGSKLHCVDFRFERDVCKAKVNRIKTKLRAIESAIMAQATMSKILQAEMKL